MSFVTTAGTTCIYIYTYLSLHSTSPCIRARTGTISPSSPSSYDRYRRSHKLYCGKPRGLCNVIFHQWSITLAKERGECSGGGLRLNKHCHLHPSCCHINPSLTPSTHLRLPQSLKESCCTPNRWGSTNHRDCHKQFAHSFGWVLQTYVPRCCRN